MSLADRVANPPVPEHARRERQYPQTTEYDSTGRPAGVTLTLPSDEVPSHEQGWRDAIQRVTGLELADDREVVLSQVRYWGPRGDENSYCRFLIRDREIHGPIDAAEILTRLRKGRRSVRPAKSTAIQQSAQGVAFNDWQYGKAEGGGTPALLERLDRQFDGVLERRKDIPKRYRPDELFVAGLGDLLEGCFIFANQPHTLDVPDRRAQVRGVTTAILEGLDRLAPHYKRVRVAAVGGNHGEHRVNGKKINNHDNDDVAVFEHAAVGAQRDPKLQHVEWSVALSDLSMTQEIQGWIYGLTHGQAYDKGSAASIEAKVYKWYVQQAGGHLPVGDANVLMTAHFHHEASSNWGACYWQQCPANDGGSQHFTDSSGRHALPGMLTWVVTPQERFHDAHIIR